MRVLFLRAGGGPGTGMGRGLFFFFLKTLGATKRSRADPRGTVAFWLQHGMQAGGRTGPRLQLLFRLDMVVVVANVIRELLVLCGQLKGGQG